MWPISEPEDTKTNQGWAHQELPIVNRVRLIKSHPWTYHSLIQQAAWPCELIRRLLSSQNSTQECQSHLERVVWGYTPAMMPGRPGKSLASLEKAVSMCHSLQHTVSNNRIHLSSSLSQKSFFLKGELKSKLGRRTISMSCWSSHMIFHCYILS